MASLRFTAADRDERGFIRAERSLADLLPVSDAAAAPPARWRPTRTDLIGIGCGLLVALALIVVIQRLTPAAPPAAIRPVATVQATTLPTAGPVVAAPVPTEVPTAAPPPTDPPPPPEPVVIVQQAPPPPPIQCYNVEQDVADSRGYPIGRVVGTSCESEADAQAKADALAAQMRGDQ